MKRRNYNKKSSCNPSLPHVGRGGTARQEKEKNAATRRTLTPCVDAFERLRDASRVAGAKKTRSGSRTGVALTPWQADRDKGTSSASHNGSASHCRESTMPYNTEVILKMSRPCCGSEGRECCPGQDSETCSAPAISPSRLYTGPVAHPTVH